MDRTADETRGSGEFRRLGVAGQEAAAAREPLAAILRNRIGDRAAGLLAIAETGGGGRGREVAWRAEDGLPLTPVSALPSGEAQALRARRREIESEVEALASRLAAEGAAARLTGRLLRLALVVPDGFEALHAAGRQPVLIHWGHAAPGQAVPAMEEEPSSPPSAPPPAPPPAPLALPTPTPGEPLAAPAEGAPPEPDPAANGEAAVHGPDGQPEERERKDRAGPGRLAWALPPILLLVLAALLWKLSRPPELVVVERAPPAPPAEDPVPALRDRLAGLESALAEARRLHAELASLCPPAPAPRSGRTEPEPPTVPPPPKPLPRVQDEPPDKPDEPPAPAAAASPPGPPPRLRPRRPPELPPVVPRTPELLRRQVEAPPETRPAPTLCEPGWTPTERPEVLVVVDGSGSMKESFPGASSRIGAAREAVARVVRSLHHDVVAGLISFSDCTETTTPRKYRYRDRSGLLARIRGIAPSRGTSLANSIRRAGNAAKSVGPATVVVVSDGEDTCGGDPCAAARALKAGKPLLKINVIDLSGGRSPVLQCVADAAGGRVFAPADAEQMGREMQEATGQPDAGRCNP